MEVKEVKLAPFHVLFHYYSLFEVSNFLQASLLGPQWTPGRQIKLDLGL